MNKKFILYLLMGFILSVIALYPSVNFNTVNEYLYLIDILGILKKIDTLSGPVQFIEVLTVMSILECLLYIFFKNLCANFLMKE